MQMLITGFVASSDDNLINCAFEAGVLTISGVSSELALRLAKAACGGEEPALEKPIAKAAPVAAALQTKKVKEPEPAPAVVTERPKTNGSDTHSTNGAGKLHAVPAPVPEVIQVKAKPPKPEPFVEDEEHHKLIDAAKEEGETPPELAAAKTMRDVLNHFAKKGVVNHDLLVDVCRAWKLRLAPLANISDDNFASRIKTAAVTLRIGAGE